MIRHGLDITQIAQMLLRCPLAAVLELAVCNCSGCSGYFARHACHTCRRCHEWPARYVRHARHPHQAPGAWHTYHACHACLAPKTKSLCRQTATGRGDEADSLDFLKLEWQIGEVHHERLTLRALIWCVQTDSVYNSTPFRHQASIEEFGDEEVARARDNVMVC